MDFETVGNDELTVCARLFSFENVKGRGLGSAGAREGVEHRWMRKTLQKMPGPRSSLHFSATITHFINTARGALRGAEGNGMGKARERRGGRKKRETFQDFTT